MKDDRIKEAERISRILGSGEGMRGHFLEQIEQKSKRRVSGPGSGSVI